MIFFNYSKQFSSVSIYRCFQKWPLLHIIQTFDLREREQMLQIKRHLAEDALSLISCWSVSSLVVSNKIARKPCSDLAQSGNKIVQDLCVRKKLFQGIIATIKRAEM